MIRSIFSDSPCHSPRRRSGSLRRYHASVRGRRRAATPCLVSGISRADLWYRARPCGRHQRTCGIVETASRRRDIGGPGLVPIQFGLRSARGRANRRAGSAAGHQAAAALRAGCISWNFVPSLHIRCSTTARRRATATTARFMPRRLATCMPQALSQLFVCDW